MSQVSSPEKTQGNDSTRPGISATGWAVWQEYAVAIGAVGLALVFRLSMDRVWGDQRPYFAFYLAAIITMCVAGTGAGLFATICGLLLGTWFFVPPRHSLGAAFAAQWVNALTYLVSSIVVLLFQHRAQRALTRERANTRELRRQAEELQASEQRFQTLSEATFEGVLLSHKGVIQDCNDQVAAIVGYTREELIGKPVSQFLTPAQREEVLRNLRENRVAVYELDLICKNGEQRTVEAHGRPLRDSNGQHLRVSVVRDVTDQKRREAFLRRQAALLELSPDAIFVKRTDDTITFWSHGAETLYGWTADEAVGAKAHDLLQTHFPIPREQVLDALQQTGHWSGELSHLSKGGTRVYVASRWQSMHDSSGQMVEFLESNIDITERKRGEEALREARDALVEANASLEQRVIDRTRSLQEATEELNAFCYTIAHDLRSPLRTQLGFAKVLVEDFGDKLGPEGKMMAEHIAAAAERQGDLIQDLLAHARVSREEMPLSNVLLPDVVKLALADIAMEIIEKKGLVDQTNLGAHLVKAHPSSLQLVVLNLLTNALKFVHPGTQPSIKISSERRNGRVRFQVEDNGIGIAPQEIEKLFGMFQRLHSAKTYPGTGMGLAIVKKAIQRMGGDLGVESEVGKGSKFWIELPAAET